MSTEPSKPNPPAGGAENKPAAAAPASTPAPAANAPAATPATTTHAAAAKPAAAAATPAKPAAPQEEPPKGLHAYPQTNRREFMFTSVGWFRLGWLVFTGAAAAGGGALQRFLFPNVLYEPPQIFKAGLPSEFNPNTVEERFKEKYACWIVRTSNDLATGKAGFYALTTVCTHLGCTPNWLAGESKFKCPCHGSGFQQSGINFEGPAPRPLERFRIVLADDGQILVDKTMTFQQEKGEWEKPESFLPYAS